MSFRLKTILGIALIEVVVLGILVLTSLHDLRTSNERELRTRAQTTAQLLATMTGDAVVSFDLATLDALVGQALTNEGLLYVQIKSADGLVLSGGGAIPPLLENATNAAIDEDLSDDSVDVSAPIEISGRQFGLVEIGLSLSLLNDVVATGSRRMLSIAGAEIFLVAVFGFILGTFLTRQLDGIRNGAARVAAGEFGYTMPVRGSDELAQTARSFNKMSRALADYARETKREKDEAEAGREIAEATLHNAMNSVSNAIFILDDDGRTRFINRSAQDLYGICSADSISGKPFREILLNAKAAANDTDSSSLCSAVKERVERLHAGDIQTWQSKWIDDRVLLHTQRPVSTGGFVLVDTDVTELFTVNEKARRLEMELMQSHKLESLGTLASGVAHEINTPTQFIGDNLKFLSESFDDLTGFVSAVEESLANEHADKLEDLDWEFVKDEIPAALAEALDGVASIGKIVRSIKEFAHPDDSETTETDIVRLVENAATVSRSQWRHSADLVFEPAQDEINVPCYPGDIAQVIINLIVNAADAISEHAETAGYPAGKGTIKLSIMPGADDCVISVTDNGPGIPDEIKRRIFDMFYTTKGAGKGTGQGLAICRQIVELKHGGKLDVTSAEGEGSTFTVKLPMKPAPAGEKPGAPKAA